MGLWLAVVNTPALRCRFGRSLLELVHWTNSSASRTAGSRFDGRTLRVLLTMRAPVGWLFGAADSVSCCWVSLVSPGRSAGTSRVALSGGRRRGIWRGEATLDMSIASARSIAVSKS